jgi:lipopolysaccharide cholinephosphotransferase
MTNNLQQHQQSPVPTLAEIQDNILQNFYALHQFCENNNLRYYLLGGTLLGAVRHGGFIPWDDDIDIGMPRSDYNKLLKLAEEFYVQSNGRYKICHTGNDKGYLYLFAKSYDTQTTLTEDFSVKFTRGVWVDIFPLDGAFTNTLLCKIHYYLVKIFVRGSLVKSGAFQMPENFIKRKAKWIFNKFFPVSVPMFASIVKWILSIKKFDNADYIGNFSGAWGYKEICKKTLFCRSIKLKFETIEACAPVGYDGYLTQVYGDYMTPPPPEKRHSHHLISYINLDSSYITK